MSALHKLDPVLPVEPSYIFNASGLSSAQEVWDKIEEQAKIARRQCRNTLSAQSGDAANARLCFERYQAATKSQLTSISKEVYVFLRNAMRGLPQFQSFVEFEKKTAATNRHFAAFIRLYQHGYLGLLPSFHDSLEKLDMALSERFEREKRILYPLFIHHKQ